MGTQHLAPPWKVAWIVNHWEVTTDRGDTAEEYDVFEDPDVETARLGSAAPDLLSACERLLSVFESFDRITNPAILDDMKAGRKAIAKAKGGQS